MQKHTVNIRYLHNHYWMMSFNFHPYDSEHVDTCAWVILLTKPTQRQIRDFRKSVKRSPKPWFIRSHKPTEVE